MPAQSFEGDIYLANFGKEGNYVPAVVGGVAGFYDTYNDKFHDSKTSKPFISGPGFNEPKESKTIPYIRGGGDGSYIDAGIAPDATTTITVWARNFAPNGKEYSWLAGSRRTYNDSAFNIYADNARYVGRIGLTCANSSTLPVSDGWKCFADYHKYEISNGALYVNDKLLTATTNTSFVAPFSIHIIGMNNSGTHVDSNVRLDICACQIYKGGQLVRDFVPKQENGVIGLYDKVSDTLFTNVGTGSFEYGEFRTNTYERLEYVSTNATAYFDAGVCGKYTDSMVCRYMPTNRTPAWHSLLGCRPDSNVFDVSFGHVSASMDNKYIYWRMGPSSGGTYNKTPYNNGASLTGREVIVYKQGDSGSLYVNCGLTQVGSATITGLSQTFKTDLTLGVGALHSENVYDNLFRGRLYYVRLGYERSFVPALVNGVAGMYDTYNDVFYPSISNTPFNSGPKLEI